MMKKDDIYAKLEELYNELDKIKSGLADFGERYIKTVEKFEQKKLEVFDPTKRDALEKQILAACKEDKEFNNLRIEVDTLRRQRDFIHEKINIIENQIQILTELARMIDGKK